MCAIIVSETRDLTPQLRYGTLNPSIRFDRHERISPFLFGFVAKMSCVQFGFVFQCKDCVGSFPSYLFVWMLKLSLVTESENYFLDIYSKLALFNHVKVNGPGKRYRLTKNCVHDPNILTCLGTAGFEKKKNNSRCISLEDSAAVNTSFLIQMIKLHTFTFGINSSVVR